MWKSVYSEINFKEVGKEKNSSLIKFIFPIRVLREWKVLLLSLGWSWSALILFQLISTTKE